MAKILLVEDDEDQRLLFAEDLEDDGHEVIATGDARDAIDKARGESPDLVVLDIAMPVMDGIEALGRMLADNNKLPVILHTAYGIYKDDFMTWSADAYVIKSADRTELKLKIREVLEARRANSSATADE